MKGKCVYYFFVMFIPFVVAEFHHITQTDISKGSIIGEFVERTITSCVMRCERDFKCKRIGTSEISAGGDSFKCYLLSEDLQHVDETEDNEETPIDGFVIKKLSDREEEIVDPLPECLPDKPTFFWPDGVYGILSLDQCPANWFEFTHCLDTEDTQDPNKVIPFALEVDFKQCKGTFRTFRYCFKGENVTSRPGGFWTSSGAFGSAFVIRNVNDNCTVFGKDGGDVHLDAEDTYNDNKHGNNGTNGLHFEKYYPHRFMLGFKDVLLTFCKIGERNASSQNNYIEVGEFNQTFGFFSPPDNSTCPVLESPYGILHATKEKVFIDLENSNPVSKYTGNPPFVFDSQNNVNFAVCVYDPFKREDN